MRWLANSVCWWYNKNKTNVSALSLSNQLFILWFRFNIDFKNIKEDFIDELKLIEPKVIEIWIDHTPSPVELELVSVLLCFRRTKFSFSRITLKFKLLSEWLSTLSLCANCTELESVEFEYSKVDLDNENKLVKSSIHDFRKKFWFIKNLSINHKKD